ncbi:MULTISPECIES: flavin reductase family protein [Actinomadura]|uniref:flavin reductase family protein n=1 Tax=Actinomadura TaxID=1988 RepID=UPI0003AD64D0|nr:flavin reductase family protein [Actinomadura madurae]
MTTDSPSPPVVSSELYRHVLGHFVTGVTVVTAMHADGPVGFTCQSFGALSMDPPLILLCAGRSSTSWPKIAASGRFAVNLLADDQIAEGRRFAVSGGDKFGGVPWAAGRLSGAPMLSGVLGWLECELVSVQEAGDHWLVVARVLDLAAVPDRQPLTFFRGTLAGLDGQERRRNDRAPRKPGGRRWRLDSGGGGPW